MAIKIAQYKGKSFFSRIIRFMTWGEYSHTAIMFSEVEIIEAWQGSNAVRVIKSLAEGHKSGTPVDIYRVEMTDAQEHLFRQFITRQVGKKYDFKGIFGFLVRKNAHKKERWFCSELFAAGCEASGVELLNNVLPHQVSPSMVTRSTKTTLIEMRLT